MKKAKVLKVAKIVYDLAYARGYGTAEAGFKPEKREGLHGAEVELELESIIAQVQEE